MSIFLLIPLLCRVFTIIPLQNFIERDKKPYRVHRFMLGTHNIVAHKLEPTYTYLLFISAFQASQQPFFF